MNKKIIKSIIEEYGVTSQTDIINALKNLLGETLRVMMDADFYEHMGYDKHDHSVKIYL